MTGAQAVAEPHTFRKKTGVVYRGKYLPHRTTPATHHEVPITLFARTTTRGAEHRRPAKRTPPQPLGLSMLQTRRAFAQSTRSHDGRSWPRPHPGGTSPTPVNFRPIGTYCWFMVTASLARRLGPGRRWPPHSCDRTISTIRKSPRI